MKRLALTSRLASLGLLALPALSPAALNLEGMTGYWMTPNAWLLEPDEVEISGARHYNRNLERYDYTPNQDYSLGMGLLPHVEAVARYAIGPAYNDSTAMLRDLSLNLKLGWTFFEGTEHPLGLAVGGQDVLGGVRFFYARYGVLTQRWNGFEASVGWGDGARRPHSALFDRYRRLQGFFGGGSVDLPLPDSFPIQAAVQYDHESHRDMLGLRTEARLAETRLSLGLVRNLGAEEWEYSAALAHGLPKAATELKPMEWAWTRLRVGPWMQSFVGTEVADFDAQVALETTPMVQPVEELVGWVRLRRLLYASGNFEKGKTFARYKQDPSFWLEGAGAGWKPLTGASYRTWVQGGMTNGSWQGGMLEGSVDAWGPSLRAGAMSGAWYSTWWHQKRLVWTPWLDWDSKDRGWFARLDAGRYWSQDEGVRVQVGRRFGRLALSAGASRTDGTNLLTGRFEFELDGIGWRAGKGFLLEPNPRIGHGYSSTYAVGYVQGNPLKPDLAQDPPTPVRGRTGTWP